MTSHRKISLAAGIFYVLTFVSIPTLALYGAIHDPKYIIGPGPDTAVRIGAVLELIVGLTGIATAAALYPLLKKQSQGMAVGLVGIRVLEAGAIFAGVATLLTIVSMRQSGVGPEAIPVGHALVTLYDRIFLISQSFLPAICDLLLGLMLYRARLVPRAFAMIGIAGGFPLVVAMLAVLFGLVGQRELTTGLTAIPVAVFEFALGIMLIVKGFNVPAAEALEAKRD